MVDMEKQLTMKGLEALLSNSQIKAQFFNFGYGVLRLYLKAYQEYGNFYDYTDSSKKRYNDFKEVEEDIKYINGRKEGKELLEYWFESNKDYINRKIFGKFYHRVKYLEEILIDNKLLQDLVSKELVVEFIANISLNKYSNNSVVKDLNNEKENVLTSYIEALESVYRLYIQKALT
jgi:hypothetical protein